MSQRTQHLTARPLEALIVPAGLRRLPVEKRACERAEVVNKNQPVLLTLAEAHYVAEAFAPKRLGPSADRDF